MPHPLSPHAIPFRIGTTSYIIPDDLVANAHYLATRVHDMQLVLFDLPDGTSNLPNAAQVAELAAIGRGAGLSYTVHLLDDVRLTDATGAPHPSLARAAMVMELTHGLKPHAYVLHLEGRDVRAAAPDSPHLARWQEEQVHALQQLSAWAGTPVQLAVENLEGYAPGFVTPVVERSPVARCVDVGHLWLDGHDPRPWLRQAGARLRVVHLHGVGDRDHQSVALTPPAQLDAVLDCLLEQHFDGVLTLEVFGEEDFTSSLDALEAGLLRCVESRRA
jgi:sugar phosphate isomerase/epimerase